MTLHNWNSKDYEVDFPDIVITEGTRIVDVPLPRKVGYLIEYLLGKILPDAQKATINGFGLAGLFIALATIDYLAGYYVGRGTTGYDYKEFMRRYFPQKYHPYLDIIYIQLRCGLLHNLVTLNPWKGTNQKDILLQERSSLHLIELGEKISFSIPIFIEDTRRALIIYQYDLIMHSELNYELVSNFEKRFNMLDGKSAVMVTNPDSSFG